MAKSVNKRFLIIFAAVFAAIATFASVRTAGVVVRADGLTPSEKAEQIYNDAKDLYDGLRAVGIEIDKDNQTLEIVYGEVTDRIAGGEDVSAMTDGNVWLNGIKEIAVIVDNFYGSNLSDAAKAKDYLKKFNVSNYKYCDYDYTAAYDFINAYGSEVIQKDYSAQKKEIEDIYAEYLGEIKAEYAAEFVSDYRKYVVKALGVNTEAQAQAIRDSAIDSLDTCVRDEDANKIVSDFNARFTDINKFIGYLDEELITARYDALINNRPSDNKVVKDYALSVAEICEKAIKDANKFYSGEENSMSHIKILYVNLCKEAVDAIRDGYSSNFGQSAYDVITANRKMAKDLIDTVSAANNFEIANKYSYSKNTSANAGLVFKATQWINVNTGSDVARAFEDSYSVKGALKYSGKSSEVPTPKKAKLTYKGEDFTFTLTSVDQYGNDVRDFDTDAYLDVRVGTTPTIERNINTILSRKDLKDKISDGVANKEALAEELAGKHIQYFYTVTVYENNVVREEFEGRYRIEIEYKEDVLSANKDNFNVINYYHTEITGVIAENKIETEGKSIMFYTDNFSQFALLADVEWVDLAKWVLIGVVAFVALVWLLLLIIYLVKNRKFTVIFNANGGRPTTHIRLKHKEKFSYPKNPVRRGHVFMGWYTTRRCDTRFASTELLNRKRLTVYAKWITEEEYKALIAESEEDEVKPAPVVERIIEKVTEAPIPAIVPVLVEGPVEEPKEEPKEEKKLDVEGLFDELVAEMNGYEKANNLPYGLEKSKPLCAVKASGEVIELEVALDKDDLLAKGYGVFEGENLATKMVVKTVEHFKVAKEIVEETMYDNGLKKSAKAAETEENIDREAGYVKTVEYDKAAESAEEFFKLLRVYAKSFVKADGDKGENKPLIKMFTLYDKVNVYLNYFEEGMNECDEAIKALGYRSLIVVGNAEECAKAEGYIKAMMKENGLIRYPQDALIADDNSDKGFAYTLKY